MTAICHMNREQRQHIFRHMLDTCFCDYSLCVLMTAFHTLQEAQWMLDQGIRPDSACAGRQALLALQHWHSHPEEATSAQLVKHTC